MKLKIGDTEVAVMWESNESVEALRQLCAHEPLQVHMSMYGGNEQFGPVGMYLPAHDVQTVAHSGDIVLFAGNQVVVFYGSNAWAYTRLGHITDQDEQGMAELLGRGDTTLTFSA